jgi:putative Mg2+ transporter-C (MgtC) family protein
LGALIGLEREFADKPAGLRTHIFVGASAALLMVLGDAIIQEFREGSVAGTLLRSDPLRVLQALVIGIGFLGAGTISHQGNNRVEGLTTAASILLTAGIGVAVAVDHVWLAVETTLFAVVVLFCVGWLERYVPKRDPNPEHKPAQDGS